MKLPFRIDPGTRHAGMSAIISIAALIGLIAFNLLFTEFKIRLDLTKNKLFSLLPETSQLLEDLESGIEVFVLYEPGQEPENIMQVIDEYPKKSSLVEVKVLDPDRNPALVSTLGDKVQPGSIVIRSGERTRVIAPEELYEFSYTHQGQPQVIGQRIEQQISSSIAYVSSEKLPVIYEITGHRETTLASIGYKETLERANYEIKELALSISSIPGDASLVTLIGPDFDISSPELNTLQTYLRNGGKLLVAVEFNPNETFENLNTLLMENGIELLWGITFENENSRLVGEFGDNPLIFAPYISRHESVSSLVEDNLTPIFQNAAGLRQPGSEEPGRFEEPEEPEDFTYTSILYTSGSAFLRTDLDSENSRSRDKIPGDKDGPIDMVALSEGPEDSALIVMTSSKTLAGLPFFGQIRANAELVTNLVDWSIDDSATVNIGSKVLFRDPLTINTNTSRFYTGLVTVIVPLICIISGIILCRKRRNR